MKLMLWVPVWWEQLRRHKRKIKPALINTVRARLMAFYLLKDQSFKVAREIGTPLETFTLMGFPPAI